MKVTSFYDGSAVGTNGSGTCGCACSCSCAPCNVQSNSSNFSTNIAAYDAVYFAQYGTMTCKE